MARQQGRSNSSARAVCGAVDTNVHVVTLFPGQCQHQPPQELRGRDARFRAAGHRPKTGGEEDRRGHRQSFRVLVGTDARLLDLLARVSAKTDDQIINRSPVVVLDLPRQANWNALTGGLIRVQPVRTAEVVDGVEAPMKAGSCSGRAGHVGSMPLLVDVVDQHVDRPCRWVGSSLPSMFFLGSSDRTHQPTSAPGTATRRCDAGRHVGTVLQEPSGLGRRAPVNTVSKASPAGRHLLLQWAVGFAAMDHHLVLHDHAAVVHGWRDPSWRPKRALGPMVLENRCANRGRTR